MYALKMPKDGSVTRKYLLVREIDAGEAVFVGKL